MLNWVSERSGGRFLLLSGLLLAVTLAASACGASPSPELPQQPAPTPAPIERSPARQQADFPSPNLRFERIGIEDGLSNSAVWHILQDSEGYMWFGTQDGLNRYDGHSFTVYRHDPEDPQSLRDDYISSIYEDRSGVLWTGTQQGWLEKYGREQDRFTPYDIGSWITSVHEDRSGVLWIGAREGLYRFDREAGLATLITSERGWVEVVYEDRAGQLWFGTEDGWFSTLDRSSGQITDYTIAASPTSIFEDHTGTLWVGTYCGGLARFDPQTKQFIYYRHDSDDAYSLSDSRNCVMSVSGDRSGALWVGTGNGLNRYDRETGRFTHYQHDSSDPHSLSNGAVLSVYQDRSGVLWTGIEFGGINKLAAGAGRFRHYRHLTDDPNSLSGDIVTSVLEDQQGVLWIGTVAGLDRLDRKNGQWKHYRHDPDDSGSLAHNLVRSIYLDRLGTLWIGTRGGLDRYDYERDRFVHYDESPAVMWMHEGPSGTLWFATRGGLFQLDRDTDRLTFLKAADSWMIMVLEDRTSVVWVGTAGDGLYRYDPANGEWRRYVHNPDDPHSLSNNGVEAIHEDESGALWFATQGGLDRFDRETETFAHYRVQDGLVNENVVGMLQDRQGNLWLATGGGLSRFDSQTETFRNYYASDGLQSNFFWRNAYYQSPSGEMFFGGQNGLTAFYPERITDNPHPPPVVITAFSLFNQVVRTNLRADEHIELDYQDNFVSFDFAALDYHNPEKNQYAYKMEGVDKGWVYGGTRRYVDYPNLSPGEYVFRVKGSNNDGVWNEEGTAVFIVIKPPFWATWWFRGILLLALAVVAFSAYRLRVRSVEARSRELEVQVTERTAELEREVEQRLQVEEALRQSEREQAVAAERSRLARELHDAVTQTLFSASLIAEVLPRVWQLDAERGRQQLEEVRLLTQGALAEMRALLLELRPDALAKANMAELLQQLGRAVTGRTGMPVYVRTDSQASLPSAVQIAFYRIAQEGLNNAARHAEANQIDVAFSCGPGWAMLTITDDGRGFDLHHIAPGHFGVGFMRERAASIGAQIEIESEPRRGTQVRVQWSADEGQPVDDSLATTDR
jgi:signal transduction histidine kinase/ligand-binding sensor domain-containing protein